MAEKKVNKQTSTAKSRRAQTQARLSAPIKGVPVDLNKIKLVNKPTSPVKK